MNTVNLYKLPKDILVKILVEKYHPELFSLKDIKDAKDKLDKREAELKKKRNEELCEYINKNYRLNFNGVKIDESEDLTVIDQIILYGSHSDKKINYINCNQFWFYDGGNRPLRFDKKDDEWIITQRKLYRNDMMEIPTSFYNEAVIKIFEDKEKLIEMWNSY